VTTREFKKIGRLLKEVYREIEQEAINTGIDLLSPEYDEIIDQARLTVLKKHGFTLEEYISIKEQVEGLSKEKTLDIMTATRQEVDETLRRVEEISERHIPTENEISEIAEEVAERVAERIAKKYIVEPKIINKIVKEIKIKEPKIVKETVRVKERVEYDDKSLRKEIKKVDEKIDDIKILTLEEVSQFFKDNFSDNFRQNINMFGMPDFRKLAMGLQQQIDDLNTNPGLKIGDAIGSLTAGSVLFGGTSGGLSSRQCKLLLG
jgi:hypothetical protein